MKHKIALLLTKGMARSIFDKKSLEVLAGFAEYNEIEALPETLTPENMLTLIKDAHSCITCWGTPQLTGEMLKAAPALKLVAHAAGSIKNLIPPELWQTKCRVTSNAPVIAQDVAQTVLAYALTSLLGLWGNAKATRNGLWSGGEKSVFPTRKINGLKVGLIGFSSVCREVIKLFKLFDCDICVHDPYICSLELERWGVRGTPLDELLSTCDIISLHAPANEDCFHILNAENIPFMKDDALFINTARGMLVDERALTEKLQNSHMFACIDVTDPEPPASDHPFRSLENVILTSHIAGGCTANGRKRLGANAVLQTYNYLTKGLLENEVREEMLAHMA